MSEVLIMYNIGYIDMTNTINKIKYGNINSLLENLIIVQSFSKNYILRYR